jgi:DNA-binding beta-propeller fold protein YncE
MSTEPNRLRTFSENKARDMRPRRIFFLTIALILFALPVLAAFGGLEPAVLRMLWLPSSKQLLEPVPGEPQKLNSFPVTLALSPDGHFVAALNAGYGTAESNFQQSIAILNLESNQVADFPDTRLAQHAHQSYFEGLAFSKDGSKLYASLGSITDPEGKKTGDTGNGIAVYGFAEGKLTPLKVIPIPARAFAGHKRLPVRDPAHPDAAPAYPSGIAVVAAQGKELLLVADNLSDDAVLLDADSGEVAHRFDLSRHDVIPAEYPYAATVMRDGKTGYVSLWNASGVAELDLAGKKVRRFISLLPPKAKTDAGSHPTGLLLNPDESVLYAALANADRIAAISTKTGKVEAYLSAKLPGQEYGGSYPIALAQSDDGKLLFAANASLDAVAVYDTTTLAQGKADVEAAGFIPTEWYPTALAVHGGELFITSGKGAGIGPNNMPSHLHPKDTYSYIASLLHGSLARVKIAEAQANLAELTKQVVDSNVMRGNGDKITFAAGGNPIHHVIYIIKENRTFDQILGDIGAGDADPSLVMYGQDITPNLHKLARQFGVLDNFYDSGEVSGDGHVWSTAAITSDYTEKTWEIGYRSWERAYDYEGIVANGYPLEEGFSDVDEPGTGYLWGNFARHGISYRHYGEFVATKWCNVKTTTQSPTEGSPMVPGEDCPKGAIHKGENLPDYLGDPHGGPSPWPWDIPILARNVATKPELRGHFDPRFPDFNLKFPDQLRVDEFLNEFQNFVQQRARTGKDTLAQFTLLRLPNDHTAGKKADNPKPTASIADNDLAVGRVVEAVSHSPYWDDTAIFIVEDDAQNGPDHVDAHRSIAFVISKYSPRPDDSGKPFVDHNFYTTVNMIHTMETLLGAPAMNNNDAHAANMAPLFSGAGNQPGFDADASNLKNGRLYEMNPANAPGAKESAAMDFSHADAVDSVVLNRILWEDRMKSRPMPAVRHGWRP